MAFDLSRHSSTARSGVSSTIHCRLIPLTPGCTRPIRRKCLVVSSQYSIARLVGDGEPSQITRQAPLSIASGCSAEMPGPIICSHPYWVGSSSLAVVYSAGFGGYRVAFDRSHTRTDPSWSSSRKRSRVVIPLLTSGTKLNTSPSIAADLCHSTWLASRCRPPLIDGAALRDDVTSSVMLPGRNSGFAGSVTTSKSLLYSSPRVSRGTVP